jgi:hypothetical protein
LVVEPDAISLTPNKLIVPPSVYAAKDDVPVSRASIFPPYTLTIPDATATARLGWLNDDVPIDFVSDE